MTRRTRTGHTPSARLGRLPRRPRRKLLVAPSKTLTSGPPPVPAPVAHRCGGATATVKALEKALGSALRMAASVYVPALLTDRPAKVAMPSSDFTVVTPLSEAPR